MSGKAGGQTTPGRPDGDVEIGSARRRRAIPLRPFVQRVGSGRRLLDPNGGATAEGKASTLILWAQLPRTHKWQFPTDGQYSDQHLGRTRSSLPVWDQWLDKALLAVFRCNVDSGVTECLLHVALVLTKCLIRERAKYPPFPVSHYGRRFLPLCRGVCGGLPLLILLSLFLLCRRFTSPWGASGWCGSALLPVCLQGAVPVGFKLPAPALLFLPLPPPPWQSGRPTMTRLFRQLLRAPVAWLLCRR